MTIRSKLMRSAAVGILVLGAGPAFSQNTPVQSNANTPVPSVPAPAQQVSVADVQAFMANPNMLLTQFPNGGLELQARIQAMLAVAAANGLVPGMMTAIQSAITAGAISPAQVVALTTGANNAAAALAAAGDQAAAAAIQTTLANPQVAAITQAAVQTAAAQTQQQPGAPQTSEVNPGALGASPPGSQIGGAGAAGGGAGGGASSSGATTAAGGGGGTSSGGGTFGGATGGGGGGSDDDDNGGGDTSPVARS